MKMAVLDIETTSLNENTCTILGIGIITDKGRKFISHPSKEDVLCLKNKLKDFRLVGHNIIFDLSCIYHSFKVDLSELVEADTQLMQHTINPKAEMSLNAMSKNWLGSSKETDFVKESVLSNGGKWTNDQKDFHLCNTEILRKYCLKDCELTLKLYYKLQKELENLKLEELFYKEVMPLYREVIIPAKFVGVPLNIPYFKKLEKEVSVNIKKLRTEIYKSIWQDTEEYREAFFKDIVSDKKLIEVFGTTNIPEELRKLFAYSLVYSQENPFVFNIASNDQLSWLLFEKMGLRPSKMSKSGKPSVDKEALEMLENVPFVAQLLEFRKEEKMLNTYIKPLIEKNVEGFIFPSFNQWGTSSGRLSSSNPNFQNLPSGDLRIKSGIRAMPGYVLIDSDFSALEPRCFAETSGCNKLIEAFKRGEDLYSRIAIDLFDIKGVSAYEKDENFLKKVNPQYRQTMKVVALAVIYGAGAKKLASILKCSEHEAQDIIDKYLCAYPELLDYMNNQEKILLDNYTISSRFGRRIYCPEVEKLKNSHDDQDYWKLRKYLNLAKNHPIQALAAHICNYACIDITREFKAQSLDARIIMQVHDEIVVHCLKKDAKAAMSIMKKCMEHNIITNQMSVPIIAEPHMAKTLAEAKV